MEREEEIAAERCMRDKERVVREKEVQQTMYGNYVGAHQWPGQPNVHG